MAQPQLESRSHTRLATVPRAHRTNASDRHSSRIAITPVVRKVFIRTCIGPDRKNRRACAPPRRPRRRGATEV